MMVSLVDFRHIVVYENGMRITFNIYVGLWISRDPLKGALLLLNSLYILA